MDTEKFKTEIIGFTGKATLMIAATATVGITLGSSCVLGSYFAAKTLKAHNAAAKQEEKKSSTTDVLDKAQADLDRAKLLMKETRELEAELAANNKATDALIDASESSEKTKTRVQFPSLVLKPKRQRAYTFKDQSGSLINIDGDEDLRNLTPEQREQLEKYVREYEEELEKAGKSSPKTTYTEA